MTPRPAPHCAHELRPGTAVCLYCRAEDRAASRKRRQRSTLRLVGGATGAALLAAAVLGTFSLLRRDGTAGDAAAASAEPARIATERPGERVGSAAAGGAAAGSAAPAGPAAVATATMAATLAPAVPVGRTALAGDMFAERVADTVVVHFDTREARTRRSDKFEAVVRQTLPSVIGEAATQALARVAPGALVPAGRLLESLTEGPLRLPVGDGRVIVVTPGSRMGQDGPLVVRYHAVIDAGTPAPAS